MIINIPLNFDETAIEEKVSQNANKELENIVKDEVYKCLKNQDPTWGGSPSRGVEHLIREIIREEMQEYKDEIIEKSVDILTKGCKRTNKYKKVIKERDQND